MAAKNARTSWLAYGLLLCLSVPFLGTYGWLRHERYRVKRAVKAQMIAGLDRSELVHLTFSPAAVRALDWEDDREFRYRGQWYDVVTKEWKEGQWHFWCWLDHEETALEKRLQAWVSHALGQTPFQEERQERLAQFGQSLYCIAAGMPVFLPAPLTRPRRQFPAPFFPPSHFRQPLTPPPWRA